MYIYTYIHTCIYIHIYTHTQINTHKETPCNITTTEQSHNYNVTIPDLSNIRDDFKMLTQLQVSFVKLQIKRLGFNDISSLGKRFQQHLTIVAIISSLCSNILCLQ